MNFTSKGKFDFKNLNNSLSDKYGKEYTDQLDQSLTKLLGPDY